MFSNEGLEFACDELAEIIDSAQGIIDVETAITDLITKICEQDLDITADTFRAAMLKKFTEIYKCDPKTFAENSQWAHEVEDGNVLNAISLDGDTTSIEDLDEIA